MTDFKLENNDKERKARGLYLIFRVIVNEKSLDQFKENMSDTEKCLTLQEAIAFYIGCRLEKVTVMKEDEV